jgi:TPR repeat protein
MWERGTGVPRSYEKAIRFYELAANQNFAPALFNLGVMYNQGIGVAKDLTKSFHLYSQAGKSVFFPRLFG